MLGGGHEILHHSQCNFVTVQNEELCDLVHIHMIVFDGTHTHRFQVIG